MAVRTVIGMSGATPMIREPALTSGVPGLTKRSQIICLPIASLGSANPRARAAASLITTVGWTRTSG